MSENEEWIQFLKEYANLTDEELQEVNKEFIRTWKKMLKILKVDIDELDSEQANLDYMYWLCFTVGMFRENQFMVDFFGGRDVKEREKLIEKIEEYRTRYIT